MTSEMFVISGGGTGAKVVEALVHLCAAGLGPRRLHVLLVDSDTSNGNLTRAAATAKSYRAMRRWPWSVRAQVREGALARFGLGRTEVWLELFGTELHVYDLTEQIQTVLNGGLATAADSAQMRLLLDLLYDPSEQTTDCSDGFRARPNLGCLLLADHLAEKLPVKAKAFLDAMQLAARTQQERIPVVVTASVFGGTGASLLPIARQAVRGALKQAGMERDQLARFDWAAVKMLPHYQPDERQDSVDPDRFLLDTASALQYYSTVYDSSAEDARYNAIFLVGSDNPGRNKVRAVLGEGTQANPAYLEEFVAALAVLRFGETPADAGTPMRVFVPEAVTWESLPHARWQELRERMAFLLHLGAFYLRRGSGSRDEQRTQGVARLIRNVDDADLAKFPWYGEILEPWGQHHPAFKATDPGRRVSVLRNSGVMQDLSLSAMLSPATEYFGRLLLWAETALQSTDTTFLELATTDDYSDLFGAMSRVKAEEIDSARGEGSEARPIEPLQDNGLVRVLRTAITAMVHQHRQPGRVDRRNGGFVLVENDRIRLRTTSQQTCDTLREIEMGGVIEEYRRTALS